jgi:hypothetical protein
VGAKKEDRSTMIQIVAQPTGERFADLQREVDRRFPTGRFVACETGVVIADDETHRQLVRKLESQGKSPKDLLIIQAGVEYPASAVIFFAASHDQKYA